MNKIYSLYYALPSFKRLGKIGKGIDRLQGKLFKKILDRYVPAKYDKEFDVQHIGINKDTNRQDKIIVSLTSFPGRINEVWICVESLMRQTFKPDAIELWLSLKQFPDRVIPQKLQRYEQRGLQINWVEDDIRSYKKYYYSMQAHPNASIVTVDDDVYYPSDMLQNLIKLHEQFPRSICANRVHLIQYGKNGEIKPYRKWKHNYGCKIPTPLPRLFVTGIGGVLYPSNSLDSMVMDIAKARDICPMADDVWLNFSAYRKNTLIVGSGKYNKDFINVGQTQKEKLVAQNVMSGGNDKQIEAVIKYLNIK